MSGVEERMPGGRKWRKEKACPRRIRRFVEPCLLLLLHRDQTHGYDLLEGLKEFSVNQTPVDSSVVYRTLREMEQAELVVSAWETEGTGPPRRVYSITPLGDEYLTGWVEDLRETDRVLHVFLIAYDALQLQAKL
jgi:PadR family transcriptional regulator PadR